MSDQTEPRVAFSIVENRKDSRVSIQIGTDVLDAMRTDCLKALKLTWRDIEQTVRPEEIRKLVISTLTHYRTGYPRDYRELEFVIRWVEDAFKVDTSEPCQRNRFKLENRESKFSVGDRVRGIYGAQTKGTVVNVPGGEHDPVEVEWDTTRTINLVRPESIEILPTGGTVLSVTPVETTGDAGIYVELKPHDLVRTPKGRAYVLSEWRPGVGSELVRIQYEETGQSDWVPRERLSWIS